jgi:monoamine oxidase
VQRSAEPVAGTLFFAGEATDALLAGTVAGALASGDRAASQVLNSQNTNWR